MVRREAGVVEARPSQPFAEVGADRGDAIQPHALDRGSKVVMGSRRDGGEDGIELRLCRIESGCPYR